MLKDFGKPIKIGVAVLASAKLIYLFPHLTAIIILALIGLIILKVISENQ
jgi:hypothetical protein